MHVCVHAGERKHQTHANIGSTAPFRRFRRKYMDSNNIRPIAPYLSSYRQVRYLIRLRIPEGTEENDRSVRVARTVDINCGHCLKFHRGNVFRGPSET